MRHFVSLANLPPRMVAAAALAKGPAHADVSGQTDETKPKSPARPKNKVVFQFGAINLLIRKQAHRPVFRGATICRIKRLALFAQTSILFHQGRQLAKPTNRRYENENIHKNRI